MRRTTAPEAGAALAGLPGRPCLAKILHALKSLSGPSVRVLLRREGLGLPSPPGDRQR